MSDAVALIERTDKVLEESKALIQRAEAFIQDHPTEPMNPASEALLQEDPFDWFPSKIRTLESAIANGDQEMIDAITNDVAHLIGIKASIRWRDNMIFEAIKRAEESQNI